MRAMGTRPSHSSVAERKGEMDLIYVALGVALFALTFGLLALCERLSVGTR